MRDPSFAVFRPGTLFHQRYQVVRCIKAGGMGAVYEVKDERTSVHRALKVMLPEIVGDPRMRARFTQEARITGGIESDHIVHISDAGVDPETETPYLVMELLRGEELASMVARRGPLPWREVMTYLSQAALALDKTHEAGIIHRDLKPENLFVTRRDDKSPCLKILDFGIAKVMLAAATRGLSTRVLGTPLYMSPEQVDAKPDVGPPADVYALGQIAYTLLVGEPYWHEEIRGSRAIASFFAQVRAGVSEPPSVRAVLRGITLSPAFDTWFLKATALSPARRYERATEAIQALEEAIEAPSSAMPPSFRPPAPEALSAEPKTLVDEDEPSSPMSRAPAGPFRLIQEIGGSGAAVTWLAEEVYEGRKLRDVVLRIFSLPEGIDPASPREARWYEEIIEEARALCRVEHPNVVRFYGLFQDRGRGVVVLAMEHASGRSLDVLLHERGRLDERSVIEAGIDVASALAAVHNAGLVHRDIKPGSVIQTAFGYKLSDFWIGTGPSGATLSSSSSLAIASTVVSHTGEASSEPAGSAFAGTPGYLAPECGEPGARPSPLTDLYALGVTLYKLSTGELPPTPLPRLEALTPVTMGATPGKPGSAPIPPAPTAATSVLFNVIALLLSPDPSARPRHADWVAHELDLARARITAGEARSSPQPVPAPALTRAERLPALHAHPPLVGRDPALAVLGRAAKEAKQGGVRIVLITGPQGIGRTRLVEAAVELGDVDADRVLFARASPERRSPLRPLLRATLERERSSQGALRPLREALERAIGADPPPSARELGNEALERVEEALLRASADAPLLLAFDDLQWGDTPTLDLLRLLIDRAGSGGCEAFHLFVVAAARNEPNPSPALRRLLGEARAAIRPGVKHCALGPLPDSDAAVLLSAVSVIYHGGFAPKPPPQAISPELERAVVRGAGGVPFFLVHALLVFRERGAIALREGVWHAVDDRALREDVPGVAELVEARLASTFDPASEPGRAALRSLAAIALYGGGLGIEVILRVTAGDPSIAEEAIEALSDAGIISATGEGSEYGFAQEMVRQAVLNLVRRRPWFHRLHRTLLDAIADGAGGTPDAAFLAAGYEKLGAKEPAREWLGRAMQEASLAGLFAEAAELGDRRAALFADPSARAAAELDVARALIQGRKYEEARQRLTRIDTRGGALDLRRRIYRLEAARGLRETGVSDPQLLADADAHGDATLRCEARLSLAGVSTGEQALALAGEAIALAERLGPLVEYAARSLRIELNYAGSRRDLRLQEEDLKRALEIAADTGSTWLQINIEGDLAVVEAELGQMDRAIARMHELMAQAEAGGMRWQTRVFLQNMAVFLHRGGLFAEAAGLAEKAAALSLEAADPACRATALSLRADALRRLGDLPAALASVNEAERLQHAKKDRTRALSLLRRAEILSAMGRIGDALADVRTARGVAEEHADQDFVIRASLWETLHLARIGAAPREDLKRILAEAAGANVRLRALTRSLMAEAEAFLTATSQGQG